MSDLTKMSVEELHSEITDAAEWGDTGRLAKLAYETHRRLAAAEAVVAKLPKTADGVPVFIGDKVWYWMPDGIEEGGASVDLSHAADAEVVCSEEGDGLTAFIGIKGGPAPWTQFPDYLPINEVYSTREAAEAAKRAEKGGPQ